MRSADYKDPKKYEQTERYRSFSFSQILISKTRLVEREEEYLPDVQLDTLKEMRRSEPLGKSKDIQQAAVLRKRNKALEEIGRIAGHRESTVHG